MNSDGVLIIMKSGSQLVAVFSEINIAGSLHFLGFVNNEWQELHVNEQALQ